MKKTIIKKQKKFKLFTKILLAVILVISLLSFGVNAVQIMSKTDETVGVNEENEEDFAYTTHDVDLIQEEISNVMQTSSAKDIEYSDPKQNIYNKMLNTVDFYNTISLTLKTNMLETNDTTIVTYATNIDESLAYQCETRENGEVYEQYIYNEYLVFVNHEEKVYDSQYLPIFTRDSSIYIPLEDRITTEEDGLPCYNYRTNPTNCTLASYSIFPQEITFSYLKDFDKWEIADNQYTYLDRNCVMITGSLSPYISEKHNIDSFIMIIDEETGIMLSYSGLMGDEVVRFTETYSISFSENIPIKEMDENIFNEYEEMT